VLSALSIVVRVVTGLVGWVALAFRSRQSLHAEVLFLRRQLALYVERGVNRIDAATRVSLALLSRLFAWRRHREFESLPNNSAALVFRGESPARANAQVRVALGAVLRRAVCLRRIVQLYRRRTKGAARWPEKPRQLSVRYTRPQCPLCFNLFICY
jgi:hypothetical protein